MAGYPRILPGYPGMPEKFEKGENKFVSNSRPLQEGIKMDGVSKWQVILISENYRE